MFDELIQKQAQAWLASPACQIKSVVEYIENRKALRQPQIEAIKVYLYLKIAGENRPLWQLFSEGFFSTKEDFSKLHLSEDARRIFETNIAARSLFEFVRWQNRTTRESHGALSEKEIELADNAGQIDFVSAAKKIFYGVGYADYLLSLPMGAGKTYLMAALIYLDLYFAQSEPDNKLFAHNFLVLIPSGLKSSIVPSLKTIENFDPAWVVREPAASNLKRLIKFEILDVATAAKKSNKAQNPNAQKISRHQPFETLTGLILVVNAEKVILDRLELSDQLSLIEKTVDEKDAQANELRALIGKIPNLQIHIDEVHHATDDEIKLRQVVNGWNAKGNVNSVLGFSGTPYLTGADDVVLTPKLRLSFAQIANTVYYYPLLDAIKAFLKTPSIQASESGLTPTQIIAEGVKDFYGKYEGKLYGNGTRAKLAIYCGGIDRLEEEIYPFLTDVMKIAPEKILKFHKGNKKHAIGKDAEMEFRALDTRLSQKEIVLLVQVGKEGWDCRSLTGVILSQKGDCPNNMVLQTSCRCLRQVDKGKDETAIIWLNPENAKQLQKQLKEEQHTSIAELNRACKEADEQLVERLSRVEHLKLPSIDFYQMRVEYKEVFVDENVAPEEKLARLEAKDFRRNAVVVERSFNSAEIKGTRILDRTTGDETDFERWLLQIGKASFGHVSRRALRAHKAKLERLFEDITYEEDGLRFFNELFDSVALEAKIRLAFHQKRGIETKQEIIREEAKMLVVERLKAIQSNPKLYPNEKETAQILELDERKQDIAALHIEQDKKKDELRALLESQGKLDLLDLIENSSREEYANAVLNKERTFHFLPYNFAQSNLEKTFLERVLSLDHFKTCDLEIYFNGESNLTEFRIDCYARKNGAGWQRVGLYTPDFLVIERRNGEIHRALIIETKGSGFADQVNFLARRKFVETEFLKQNNENYGYTKFDYLYLSDAASMEDNLLTLKEKLRGFFCA